LKNRTIKRNPHSICVASKPGLIKVGNELMLSYSNTDSFKRQYALGRNIRLAMVMMFRNLKKGGDTLPNRCLEDQPGSMRKAVDHINECIPHLVNAMA
jgi:hypothetical protein